MSARQVSALAAALWLSAPALYAQQPPPGQSPSQQQLPPAAAQTPQTTFRSSLDLIAVDVQVIDRDGVPVAGLGPDKFEVTINGRRRRVVSANLIESRSATTLSPAERAVASAPAVPELARVVMIAVDCISIGTSAARDVFETARQFIDQLPATDELGLFAYPMGPKLNPTTDHAAVSRALSTVMGQRDLPSSRFHLRPSEIVDLTAAAGGRIQQDDSMLDAVARRECGDPIEESCRRQLMMEITNAALYYEGQGNASLGMLRSLLEQMGSITGRKTLVLISGGMMASDAPGGRPDINELGLQVGKEAARSNTSIYTLFLDTGFLEGFAAETRSSMKNLENVQRDSTVLSRWLEQFAGASGGALFKVQVGSGQSSFARILNETSSYYLLGVEPGDADRDGMTHEIKVKTTQRNVTLRGRRWVTVPKRDEMASASKPAATPTTVAAPAPPPLPAAPPRRPISNHIKMLAVEFDRAEEDLQRALVRSPDLANTIRDFRAADSPWPDSANRTAVFALELAVAALRSDNQYARDEGGRLLAEYNARIRQVNGADAFECSWLWTEVVALEGMFMADSAMLFVPRAVERCPNEPRLRLAHAVVSEQQWLRRGAPAADEAEILQRYQDAMKSTETAPEARVRAAWFLCRTGKLPEALALVDSAKPPAADRYVSYLNDLVRGQVLRASGKLDEAAAAFRSALNTWPGAQSSRVALMTLLLSRGDRREATALAEAVETAPDSQMDPWWTFWLGDYRAYPAIVGHLREVAR